MDENTLDAAATPLVSVIMSRKGFFATSVSAGSLFRLKTILPATKQMLLAAISLMLFACLAIGGQSAYQGSAHEDARYQTYSIKAGSL